MGLDPTRLVSPRALQGPQAFELWEENVEAFEVFSVCRRQWRSVAGMSGLVFLGLDLNAVDVAMRRLSVPDERQREVLHKISVMEEEGLKVLNR